MNLYELIEQKFRSGNNVDISSVRISRAEWEAAKQAAVPEGSAGWREILASALKLLREIKRGHRHARCFGPESLQSYRQQCSVTEGDVEEWLAESGARARLLLTKQGGA